MVMPLYGTRLETIRLRRLHSTWNAFWCLSMLAARHRFRTMAQVLNQSFACSILAL